MYRYTTILGLLVILLALGLGCDDRGTNIELLDASGVYASADPEGDHVYQPALTLQLRNSKEMMLASVYWTEEAILGPTSQPTPTLVLLAPEGGQKYYYFRAGLAQIMQELIASGRIRPMVVFCIASDQTFGGYFYGDSDPAGHYDAIFDYDPNDGDDDVLEFIHQKYPSTIEQQSKRGIGGIGQGAYGAFRAVINNPGVYGSISVADGPLDFDGAGGGGLISLFDDALAEQTATYAANPQIDTVYDTVSTSPLTIDTSYNTLPFDMKIHFDSSSSMPVSQMFIGGSLAFSPDDTLMEYDRVPTNPATIDLGTLVRYRLSDNPPPEGGEWKSFIENMIKGDDLARSVPDGMDFHLPFDGTGALYSPIWSLWLQNNLDSLHQRALVGGDPLDGVAMYVMSSPEAKWNYYQMTQSWLNYLEAQPGDYELIEKNYGGYGDTELVEGDEYLFDILHDMIIFHNDQFYP